MSYMVPISPSDIALRHGFQSGNSKKMLFNPYSDGKNLLAQYNTVELPNWQLSGNLETR